MGPLVGRETERATLRAALDDVRGGRGRLVLLTGPAGIGKTALADDLAADAGASGVDVLWGSGWEAGGAPAFRPWTQVLRELARLRGPEVLGPGVAGLVPELVGAAPAPAASDGARFALFDAVGAVLRAAAHARPLLVVIDDLHVAGGPSDLMLQHVAADLHRAPVLLLATRRSGRRAGWESAATVLDLAGLRRTDVDALVAATTGVRPDDGLGARIVERTEGNPLFVGEVARLIAAGATDTAAWPVPAGIRQAIEARLATLGPACVRLLQTAAVIGRTVDVGLLARVATSEVAGVADLLGPTRTAALVVDDGPARFRFAHDLVRETLYDALAPRDRAAAHARVLAALPPRDDVDPGARLAVLARHAVAAIPVVDGATAAVHARRAGGQALRAFAFEQAADLFRAALDALDTAPVDDPATRCALLLDRAEALAKGGDPPGARELATTAAALARRRGDIAALARAALVATERTAFNDIDTDAVALLTEAIAATRDGAGPDHARLLARMTAAAFHARPADREAHADAAVAAARACGDDAVLAAALSAGLYARWGRQQAAEVLPVADEIVALAGADRERAIDGLTWRLVARLERGELDLAERDVHTTTRLADELRQPLHRLIATSRRSTLALLRGRLVEALALAREARAIGIRGREPDADAVHWGQVFAVGLAGGDVPDADTEVMERIVRELVAASPMSAPHGAGLVVHCLRTGRGAEARGRFDALVAQVPAMPPDMLRTWTLTVLAQACVELADPAGATVLHDALAPLAGRFAVAAGGVTCSGAVDHWLGILDGCRGRHDEAAAHLTAAETMHARAGAPLLVELTRAARRALGTGPGDGGDHDDGSGTGRAPTLRRDGEVWAVTWEGRTARVADVKGMRYLADLLATPGRELRAFDLLRAHAAGGRATAGTNAGLHDDSDSSEPVLDARARAAYRARLAELRSERDEARDWQDPQRAARIELEIEAVAHELGAALGRGGRPRRTTSDAERARISVTRAVRAAIGRIAAADPGIGTHLERSVVTGAYCRYTPRS